MPNGARAVNNTVTINGVVFSYVDASVVTSPSALQIAVNSSDTTGIVASRTATAINGFFGAGSATASSNGVTTALSVTPGNASDFAVFTSDAIITNLAIDYTSRDTDGVFRYTPVQDAFGQAQVTITATDAGVDGLFGTADDETTSQSFTITILPVNNIPTISFTPARTIQEDSGSVNFPLTGISPGAIGEFEDLRISATFDPLNVLIVPGGGNAVGRSIQFNGVTFDYVTTSTGASTDIVIFDVVTLVTKDSTTEVAQATADTLNAHFGPGTASAWQNTVFTPLSISAPSDFVVKTGPEIIDTPIINYAQGDDFASIDVRPLDDQFGTVHLTITVEDAGVDGIHDTPDDALTTIPFHLTVNAVNDAPSLDPLSNLLLPVSAPEQVIDLSGIFRGPANELDDIQVTVVSSNPDLIPTPDISYVSPQNAGTITFTPVSGQSGAAIITVTVTDNGVDGVFDDPLTPINERADNRSVSRSFRIATPPIILTPMGTISDSTPLLSWTDIQGSIAYDFELHNLTEDVAVSLGSGRTAATGFQITDPLGLGEYQLRVRALDALGVPGLWSDTVVFTVGTPTSVLSPTSERLPDSTPTFGWTPVDGADSYTLEIFDAVTGQSIYRRADLTSTQHTVEIDLPLGNYRYEITAVNNPSATSTNGSVSVVASAPLTISTPPEVLTPFVAIYDTTPEIRWTLPVGAAVSDLEVLNATTGQIEFTETDIVGDSYTVPASRSLAVGEYRVRVRSFGDVARTIDSDFSTVHVFQVGDAPTLLGPSSGSNVVRTNNVRPTLTWEGSLDGETYKIWLASRTTGKAAYVIDGLSSESWTPPADLPVGEYRYWVQARTGTGEPSRWSNSYDFMVVTAPVISNSDPSTLDRTPTIRWNAQENVDSWQIWVNKVDEVPARTLYTTKGLTTPEFTIPGDLTDGSYKVWVRGYAVNEMTGNSTTVTDWSNAYSFEVGGRPVLTHPRATTDTTPTFTWFSVAATAGYEIFVSRSTNPGTAIIRETNITSNSYTVQTPLTPGTYMVWVRGIEPSGKLTKWSLTSQAQVSINSVTDPVLESVASGPDQTPTFTWGAVTNAVRYEVFVSRRATPSVAVLRDDTITSTSYTAVTNLTPDDYRVWVRAIDVAGNESSWSIPASFTVTVADTDTVAEPVVVLTSLEPVEATWEPTDVSTSHISGVAADAIEVVEGYQPVIKALAPIESKVQSENVGSEASDNVMAAWDDAIWEEESAALAIADITQGTDEQKVASAGWLAGLAALTPSFLRRRRKEEN